MKKLIISIFLFYPYAYGQGLYSNQESLLVRTIKGGSGIIYAVAYSPDGKYAASGGVDTSVRIWNAEDGALAMTLSGHKSFINAVAYSPDGKTLASGSEDGMIKLWDPETGVCKRTLKGHLEAVSSLVFFPDGGSFASAGGDGMIRLWRVKAKKPYKTINTRSGYVYSVAVSSDGTRLASGAADRNIKLWNAKTGVREMTLEGHIDAVNSVAFSGIAGYLASASDDTLVKVWRLSDGMCIKTFSGRQRPLYAVAYSPDGNYIFAAGGDKQVTAWRVSDAMPAREFKGHSGQIKSLAVSPDGIYILSGSYDKTMKLWLTPWEADRRDKEMRDNDAKEAERKKNYNQHYAAGIELLAKPTKANLVKAVNEFTQALSYKPTEDCGAKLKEAQEALKLKEEEWRRNIRLGLIGLAALLVLAIVYSIFAKIRKKAVMRRTLPGEIRNETLAGNYERALRHYQDYKAVGGDPKNLPQVEMMELFRGMQALSDLPKENLPCGYLFSYAVAIAREANYKLAFTMMRSGRLLDEFKTPAEFDTFVEIFTKAGRPDMLFALKLTPEAYSALAESLFKARESDICGKVCSLKKQFYADKMSPRDSELLAACQKRQKELDEQKKNARPRWRCINCGYIHEAGEAPESCPSCSHPREHFRLADD